MAFKIVVLCALLASASAGYLGGIGSYGLGLNSGYAGYAHSYSTPLAYSAGLYSGGHHHISSYASPVISKTIATAPLAYSSPLAHYSAPLAYSAHHAHAPALYSSHHHIAAPIVTKAIHAPALAYSSHHHLAAPVVHKTFAYSAPVIAKSYSPYSYGAHSYGLPSYGYASNYNW